MKVYLPLLLPAAAAWLAADEYAVYIPEGSDTAALEEQLLPLKEIDGAAHWSYVPLSRRADSEKQAARAAMAIRDGVSLLPCLALSDERGCYACLPLSAIGAEQIAEARRHAQAPDRDRKAKRRNYEAARYLLFARLSFKPATDLPACRRYIDEARRLATHESADVEDRQLLGLRVLYPLLMKKYSLLGQGAHTPESEAALLEAIAALEAARDLDPLSVLGRQAHAERERLRAARLKSRQYE